MSNRDTLDSMELSDEELKLLTYLLEQEGIDLPKPQTIFPRGKGTTLPLSFAQERLWFLDQWDSGAATYNVPSCVRLVGRLDRRALLHGLNEVIRRHEALRTSFPAVDGRPTQVIAPTFTLQLPLVDLGALPDTIRERTALRLLADEVGRPFDLAAGPPLRVLLIRLAEAEHAFLLTMHHIICDGWSITIFIQELAALYRAFALEQPLPLPDPPIQYADFAIWQREWLQGEVLETQLAYWKQQLGGLFPVLDLPTDRPRPPVQTHQGAREEVVIADSTVAALRALCQEQGATLFMALLAGFSVLLSRYSSQTDIIIGSPIANRDLVEIEELIGYFVNTLVLRIDLSRPASFRELVRRVRDTTLDAHAHQNLPFEQLVEALQPARDPSRTPLFQVMFVLQNTPSPVYELPDLTMSPISIESRTAKFDLLFNMVETTRGLLGRLEYNSDLFEAATARRMLDHFQNLLRHAAANPSQRVAELPLMSEAERAQLLVAWNRTDAGALDDRSVEHLIAGQAARTPDAVAVVFDAQTRAEEGRRTKPDAQRAPGRTKDEQDPFIVHRSSFIVTYAELNTRSNRLAHSLRRTGVGPETLVAICMERSLEMVVALLGVLKAGGAYVPLDPGYPAERIAFMLEDSRARVLITRGGEAGGWRLEAGIQSPVSSLQSPDSRQVVDLRAGWHAIAQRPDQTPESGATAGSLAYVIYTSGSTGTPKGVLVTRQGLANHCRAVIGCYGLSTGDRVLQLASLNFDLAAEEIYPTLASGATLVLWPHQAAAAPHEFLDLAERERLTVLDLTTPLWQVWATEQADTAQRVPAALRLVIVGGDQALAEQYAAWRRAIPDRVRWINSYGPTEATIIATTYAPDAGAPLQPWGGMPIGRPIANTRVYLLDPQMQPMLIGVPGELHIGGAGLARGYLARPDLTAERFIPNPFVTMEDERRKTKDEGSGSSFVLRPSSFVRLYRTGDVARWGDDGVIEFLGRLDRQVKVRGFRVELGEIEVALQRHPAVREAAADVRETAAGDRLLVAYVVPTREQGTGDRGQENIELDTASLSPVTYHLSPTELRTFLKQTLPDYMIPALVVTIKELPRLPNGKVDHGALPVPELRADASTSVAPRDWLELQLVQLWEELLDVRPIGVKDPFFALGGHSLLAVRLMARLRELTGVALPIATLFRHPTVEQLAQLLRNQAQPVAPSALVGITTTGNKRPLFCIHPLGGNVLCYAQLARQLGPEQPVYGIQSPGLEHDQALPTNVEGMAAEYVQTIRAVQGAEPFLLCGWSVGGVIALEIAQQLRAMGQEVALLALLDSYALQPVGGRLLDDRRLLVGMARQLGLTLDLAALQPLEAEQQLAYVLEQAQRSDATLPGLDLAQFRRLFAVYKANALALAQYAPRPYAGRVTLFRAEEAQQRLDLAAGWEALAMGGVELCDVPGTHETMLREPHVRALAERLQEAIAPSYPAGAHQAMQHPTC